MAFSVPARPILALEMPATEPLRTRKKRLTRERILDEALRLFAERGFEGTTADDIAAAADVSRRTFFRYYPRKEDVVIEWKRQGAEAVRAAVAARPPEEPPLTAVHRALSAIVEQYQAEADVVLGLVRLIESSPTLRARAAGEYPSWEASIAEEIAARLGVDPHTDLRPRLVAQLGMAILSTAVEAWTARGGQGEMAALLDEAFEAAADQLAAPIA